MSDSNNLISNINNVSSDKREVPAIWKDKELSNAKIKTTIKGKKGVGYNNVTPGGTGGTGAIASPLTEQSRTYHADKLVTTSDGLFTLHIANPDTINFKDANNKDVALTFDDV